MALSYFAVHKSQFCLDDLQARERERPNRVLGFVLENKFQWFRDSC